MEKQVIDESHDKFIHKMAKLACVAKTGNVYDGQTYSEAIQICLACGRKGYEFLKNYLPLPSLRSLQSKAANVQHSFQAFFLA